MVEKYTFIKRIDPDDNDLVDDIVKPEVSHAASQIADLLVESGSLAPKKGQPGQPFTRESAIHYLFHTSTGAALLRRLSKKEDNPVTDFKKVARSIAAAGEVSN